jgi:glucosamine 6-phosphate synthetase-like amidotransferase/phosphosugar isomerase protein
LIGWELDNEKTLKEALKNVVERKLLGTYQISVMENKSNPEVVYFVKNSGDYIIGTGKQNNEVVVSSERSFF